MRNKACFFFFHENAQHNQNQEHNRFVYRDIAASCVPEMTIFRLSLLFAHLDVN